MRAHMLIGTPRVGRPRIGSPLHRTITGYRAWQLRDQNGAYWPLQLDFTRNYGYLNGAYAPASSMISTTRALAKVADSSSVVTPYRSFASGVPAITNLGLDIEAARTNIEPNNLGTPNPSGSNTCVVTTDIPPLIEGFPVYKHTFNQVGGDDNVGFLAQPTAWALNTVYVLSMYVYSTANEAPQLTNVRIAQDQGAIPWDGARVTVATFNPALTDQWQRIFITNATSAAGTNNPFFGLRFNSSTHDNLPGHFLYSTGWQFEEALAASPGTYPSSVIATTAGAIQRPNDVITVSSLPTFSATGGTLYAEFMSRYDSSVSVFPGAVLLSDGTTNNRIDIHARSVDDTTRGEIVVGNAQQFNNGRAYAWGTVTKAALAWAANDYALSIDGQVVLTGSVGTIFTPSQINLGIVNLTNGFLFGKLRQMAYVGARQPNALLQSITGPH
jgi:hypothetical protein